MQWRTFRTIVAGSVVALLATSAAVNLYYFPQFNEHAAPWGMTRWADDRLLTQANASPQAWARTTLALNLAVAHQIGNAQLKVFDPTLIDRYYVRLFTTGRVATATYPHIIDGDASLRLLQEPHSVVVDRKERRFVFIESDRAVSPAYYLLQGPDDYFVVSRFLAKDLVAVE